MWYDQYLWNTIHMFLPTTARIIKLNKRFKRSAVEWIDLDGDNKLEIVGVYKWQGDNYSIVLKNYCGNWYMVDNIKGTNYITEYFGVEARIRETCQHTTFPNKEGIDFSSVKYICSEKVRDKKLEKALIKEFELDQLKNGIRYYYNKVDLNGDGNPEIFVYLIGPLVCGTGGCSGAIFRQQYGDYALLTRFSLVNNPVIIRNSKTNGYKDIIMYVSGGGIESFFASIKFDGTTYPSNPSIQPKVEPGTKVEGVAIVADDITKNPGIEINIQHYKKGLGS